MTRPTSRQLRLGAALGALLTAIAGVPAAASTTSMSAEADLPGSAEDDNDNDDDGARRDSQSDGWQLDPALRLTVRGIAAESTAPAEDEVIDGNALAVVITPSLVLSKDDVTVTVRNATTRLEFEDAGRLDRWQNAARLSVRLDLSEATSVTVFGERSDNILAAEFTSTDEWEAGGEFEARLDAANRVQLGASWRERAYDDAENARGSGPRFDGEYRYRFGANHYAFLRGRYDEINSDENARRNLARWLAEASYQRPLARDLRVRGEISYQRLDYSGRLLAGGGVREDDLFWPELTLIWSPGAWRIAAEARYIVRGSSDPAFDRSGYRFEMEVSHAF